MRWVARRFRSSEKRRLVYVGGGMTLLGLVVSCLSVDSLASNYGWCLAAGLLPAVLSTMHLGLCRYQSWKLPNMWFMIAATALLSNCLCAHLNNDNLPRPWSKLFVSPAPPVPHVRDFMTDESSTERGLARDLAAPKWATPDETTLLSWEYRRQMSVVIAARDEDEYISKTLQYLLNNTSPEVLKEIIVVDDSSVIPIERTLRADPYLKAALDAFNLRKHQTANVTGGHVIQTLRFDFKQGLIRSKIAGADLSTAANIFFLDAHCRVEPGWETGMFDALEKSKPGYRTVVVPEIYDIDRYTWEDKKTYGLKMMFDWTFEFDWYEDLSDDIPIMPGGILLISRKWWIESGRYDAGMLEWGGENIEQSLRVWLCGGAIKLAKQSRVGHIFDRPPKPNPGNRLVTQVQKNQKRAALTWLDDYYPYIEKYHPVIKHLDEGGGVSYRQYLRHEIGCKKFQDFVDRFPAAFERQGLLEHRYHYLQNRRTKLCLTATLSNKRSVTMQPCQHATRNQMWSNVFGNRMLHNLGTKKCLTLNASARPGDAAPLMVADCEWKRMMLNKQRDQFWFMNKTQGSVVTDRLADTSTLDGNDKIKRSGAGNGSFCLDDTLASVPYTSTRCQYLWQWLW